MARRRPLWKAASGSQAVALSCMEGIGRGIGQFREEAAGSKRGANVRQVAGVEQGSRQTSKQKASWKAGRQAGAGRLAGRRAGKRAAGKGQVKQARTCAGEHAQALRRQQPAEEAARAGGSSASSRAAGGTLACRLQACPAPGSRQSFGSTRACRLQARIRPNTRLQAIPWVHPADAAIASGHFLVGSLMGRQSRQTQQLHPASF